MKSFLTPDRFAPKTLQNVADYLQFSHILKSLDQQQAKEKQQIVLEAQKEIDWLKESLNQVVLMMITPELEAARAQLEEEKARRRFDTNRVLILLCAINESITYDNEEEAKKGKYGLPVRVIEMMSNVIQDMHDAELQP